MWPLATPSKLQRPRKELYGVIAVVLFNMVICSAKYFLYNDLCFFFPKTISEVQRNIFILTVVYFFHEDALSNPVI